MWAILTKIDGVFENVAIEDDGKPLLFATREEAEAELADHLASLEDFGMEAAEGYLIEQVGQ
jgi:hypothetical protein